MRMLEDRPVPLLQDVLEVLGGAPPGGIVLAHVAEPPGELGEALAVGGVTLPCDGQVRRLQELRAGDQGDAWLAENVHRESSSRSVVSRQRCRQPLRACERP